MDKFKVRPVLDINPKRSSLLETSVLLIERISSPTSITPALAAAYPRVTSLIILPSVTIPNFSLLLRESVTKNVGFISEKNYKWFHYCDSCDSTITKEKCVGNPKMIYPHLR